MFGYKILPIANKVQSDILDAKEKDSTEYLKAELWSYLPEECTHTAGGVAGPFPFHQKYSVTILAKGITVSRLERPRRLLEPNTDFAAGDESFYGIKRIIVIEAGHTGYQSVTQL